MRFLEKHTLLKISCTALVLSVIFLIVSVNLNSATKKDMYLYVNLDSAYVRYPNDMAEGTKVLVTCFYPKEKAINYPMLKLLSTPINANIESIVLLDRKLAVLKVNEAEWHILTLFLDILEKERPKDCYITIKK